MSLVAQYRGRQAEWRDLERVFAAESRQDLRWFFAQWVKQDGAPVLSLPEAIARPVAGEPAETFQLEATIVQSNKLFRLPLQLLIRMEGDREQVLTVPLRSLRETISVTLPARPIAIDLDPEFMTVRRIARQSLPPVLNHYVTDRRRSVLTAFTDEPNHPSPFRDVVARIETQEQQKPIGERTVIASMAQDGLLPQCTSWKQPYDQGIFNALKARYKFLYLRDVLRFYDLPEDKKESLLTLGTFLRRGRTLRQN